MVNRVVRQDMPYQNSENSKDIPFDFNKLEKISLINEIKTLDGSVFSNFVISDVSSDFIKIQYDISNDKKYVLINKNHIIFIKL